ncbi:MAG: TVP38/TMEM64 family protein, partial [Treponema sp.]|nr:TVP38/TMEM64 family protein [Treponema sp.]
MANVSNPNPENPSCGCCEKTGRLKNLARVGIVMLIAAAIGVPQSRALIARVAGILGSADLEPVKAYILSFGPLAAVVSFLLMLAQAVAAPFPAFLITLANAALFGWAKGAILSWSSAMAGAALCFGIARLFGRGAVEKLAGKTTLNSIDAFFLRYGARSIIIARLLPFVPFDPVSYAAGLTGISFIGFFAATGAGQLPATIVYSYFGSTFGG